MNVCTVCSSKYPFLLNDCLFENDQITCFRVEVIENIFNTTINFYFVPNSACEVLPSKQVFKGVFKEFFFFNITRDPRV